MVYEKISEIAKKKNISISELERRAGLSKATISKWKTSSPKADNLKSVATVLNVKVDELLE